MRKNVSKNLIMTPMPVLVLATYDENNIPNAMTAAWGMQCDFDAVTISLGRHKTCENLKNKKAFTISFGTQETIRETDYFGIETGANLNKVEKVGFHVEKSQFVDAPVILEYPLTIECEVMSLLDDEGDYRLTGRVVNVQADERVLDENGEVSFDKLGLICYDSLDKTYRLIGESVGHAFKDGLIFKDK